MSLQWTTVTTKKGKNNKSGGHNCATHQNSNLNGIDAYAKIKAAQAALAASNREYQIWSTETRHTQMSGLIHKLHFRLRELEESGFIDSFRAFIESHMNELQSSSPSPPASTTATAAAAGAVDADTKAAPVAIANAVPKNESYDIVCYGVGSSLHSNINAQLQLCVLLSLAGIQSGASFWERIQPPELVERLRNSQQHSTSTASSSSSSSSTRTRKRHHKKQQQQQQQQQPPSANANATTGTTTASADTKTIAAANTTTSTLPTSTPTVTTDSKTQMRVYVYDPLLSALEIATIESFGITVIGENEEGKRNITKHNNTINGTTTAVVASATADNNKQSETASSSVMPVPRRTLFYMPHCGRGLYNNVIWSNWSTLNLHRIAIFGNSFALYQTRGTTTSSSAGSTNTVKADTKSSADSSVACLNAIHPYTTETPLSSQLLSVASNPTLSLALSSAFNDSSLHTFQSFPDAWNSIDTRPPEYHIASVADPEIIPSKPIE